MKILIVSDSHRKDENLLRVIERESPLDMFIHLGDIEDDRSMYAFEAAVGKDCEVHMVLGNNDFFLDLEREEEIMIGKYKALITHGHMYGVSLGADRLYDEAKARGVDIAMFGHTHRPYVDEDDITLLNPGSISFPRQEGHRPSYLIMTIDDETQKASYEIKYL